MPRSRPAKDPVPRFAIAPIIAELTGISVDDIPTGMGWVRMCCPFHDERRPSAAINYEVQGFECKGCGVKGDAVKLLQTQSHLGFKEALDRARYLSGDSAPVSTQGQPARKRRASDLFRS